MAKGKRETKVTFSIDKFKDFPDWYDKALEVGEIVDTRYPLKGMMIWKPYGFKALKLMMSIIEHILDRLDHHEVYFPLLAPASTFAKERDFLKGFKGEAFTVTKAGQEDLVEKLYLRPTSETVIYDSIRPWIRSEADLPLKLYQTVNIFRYEGKQTRPLLRLREIVKFKEAHTFHATAEEADKQIKEGVDAYKEFFDTLLIPYIIVKTVSWDTFAGALYNYDLMSVMPDGKALELGSVINLGNKFAKAFDLKYLTSEGKHAYVYQTCYGISERELGAAIAIHGDNNGLILPPVIAPIQIIIVPIVHAGEEAKLLKKAEELKNRLTKVGYRAGVDQRDKTMGEKFYELEAKGIPIRIEIGPKELESGKLIVFRRDTREKTNVEDKNIESVVQSLVTKINDELRKRGKDYLQKRILHYKSVQELKKEYTERLGMVGLPWCGDENCGRKLEEATGMPSIGYTEERNPKAKCASCGKANAIELFFGRTY